MSNIDCIRGPSEDWSTLVDMLRARANEHPARVVYTFLGDGEDAETHMTYGELDQRARAIAEKLADCVVRGAPVLLLYPPGLDYIAGFFGCLYAGVLAVPAYPPFNERQAVRLQKIAQQAGATLVLSVAHAIDRAKSLTAKAGIDQLQFGFNASETAAEGATFGRGLVWVATDELPAAGASWSAPEITAQDLAFLQYTSGSTSSPKGVMLTHRNLMHNLRSIGRLFGLRPGSASVSWLPPYHDMGLIGQILEPAYHGVHTYLMSPASFLQSPIRWLRTISRTRSEVSGGPNFAYELAARKAQSADFEDLDLSCWRVAFNGAEPVRAETLDAFADKFGRCGFDRRAFYPCYGMAEGTLLLSGGAHDTPPVIGSFDPESLRGRRAISDDVHGRRLVSCGRAAPDHRVEIVDPETLTRCPDGNVGEIWIHGPSVAAGYWRQEALSQRTFQASMSGTGDGSFLRTGDLGFKVAQELFVVGRLKDLIILRGRNLHPEDIELTVSRCHPEIRPGAAAAFAIEHAGEECLAIVQEVGRRPSSGLEEIAAAIRLAVAEEHGVEVHAVALVQTGAIPKTSSGKIQRYLCREAFGKGELREVHRFTRTERAEPAHEGAPSPRTPANSSLPARAAGTAEKDRIEAWLVDWVSARAGVSLPNVSVGVPFAHYGLGSRDVVTLSGDLQQWLGRQLSPVLAYQYPTIQELAAHLSAGQAAVNGARRPRSSGGEAEPIAIVGLSCRFPGAPSPESYWQLLAAGVDAISDETDRWSAQGLGRSDLSGMTTSAGGFLPQVDAFDAEFFGISPREAAQMDPQQRLLLEVAWEALERAGAFNYVANRGRTGVFIGISTSDYAQLMARSDAPIDAYVGTGTASSMAANRLSYHLDLRGPSLAIDTACSSSLVSVHVAMRSLRRGECDAALAGGVNLLLSPDPTLAFSRAQMMAKRGRCRTFDAAADGYVRGEGCGVLVLKRLSDALRNGDHVVAVIRGSAVNQDGRSNGLTAPNGRSQQEVIREALSDAGLSPADIDYVEAHGTGTPLGDPIEMDALKAVLTAERPADRRCGIGSVKTNIGHLEAAAGVAGVIKTALAIERGVIPAHLHCEQLNPAISLEGTPLFVPRGSQPWPNTTTPRRAGISSFGFGGTNCHVILEQAPAIARSSKEGERSPHVLALSARTDPALAALAGEFGNALQATPEASLADICFSANAGRAHHDRRLAATASSIEELSKLLGAFAEGTRLHPVQAGAVRSQRHSRVVFLFTGQGSQYPGMGRELYETEPRFRQELEQCAEILRRRLDEPLLSVMYGDKTGLLGETIYTQPALFALEWALSVLWRSWGIEPRGAIGHSIGEYVAACVSGVFSLEDGLELVAARGRLMQALPEEGAMVALRCAENVAIEAIKPYANDVSIAAINAPTEVVISGVAATVKRVCEELQSRGVALKPLNVSHAFHSPLMDGVLEEFERVARTVKYRTPQLDLISNVTGSRAGDEVCTASYWSRHARQAVRFADGLATLRGEGYTTFVEVGPAPVLTALGNRMAVEGEVWASSLQPGRADRSHILANLGTLYVSGAPVDWRAYHAGQDRRQIVLPTYPFERRRFWFEAGTAKRIGTTAHSLLGERIALPGSKQRRFESSIQTDFHPFLEHHRVFDEAVLPAAGYLEMALAAGASGTQAERLCLEEVAIRRPMLLDRAGGRHVQTVVTPAITSSISSDYTFEIYSRAGADSGHGARDAAEEGWTLNVSGKLKILEQQVNPPPLEFTVLEARCEAAVSPADFYRWLEQRGLSYGPSFQAIERLWRGESAALGQIRLPANLGKSGSSTRESYQIHPVILDACLQVAGAAFADDKKPETWLPVGMDSLALYERPSEVVWSYVEVRPEPVSSSERVVDIRVLHPDGRMLVEVRGLHLRTVEQKALTGDDASMDNWFYQVEWRPRSRRGRQLPADYLPAPFEILQAAGPQLQRLREPHAAALEAYPRALSGLEHLAASFAFRGLRELGWQPSRWERFSTIELAERLGIVSRHRRLLDRILEMFREERILERDEEVWKVIDASPIHGLEDPSEQARAYQRIFPEARHEFELLERTGAALAQVLQGRTEPLGLLFPSGDMATVTAIYQDTAGAQVLNRTAAGAIAVALRRLPATRTLRILEVGAGTGATTAHLLPILPRDQTEYVFTDVSPAFMSQAKRKFQDYSFLQFRPFDVEKAPEPQGFHPHDYDLIVASNVLHATRDLTESIGHLRRLLAPNGMLVLSEGTTAIRWLDLTFGLMEGWWRFADVDLRRAHPLLDEQQWRNLLLANGFESVANVASAHEDPAALVPTAILLARAHGDPATSATRAKDEEGLWLIFAESELTCTGDSTERGAHAAGIGEQLAARLSEHGKRTRLVFAGDGYEKRSDGAYTIGRADLAGLSAILRDIERLEGVVLLWSLGAPGENVLRSDPSAWASADELGWGATLQVVQALAAANLPRPPSLWIGTRGAVSVGPKTGLTALSQSPLWGMGRTIQLEHPELRCRIIDVDPEGADGARNILEEILAADDENQIAFRESRRHVARLVRSGDAGSYQNPGRLRLSREFVNGAPFRLEIRERGILGQLTFTRLDRIAPGPGEVEIRIRATGLNFRDVLNAMGLYPGDPGPLGCDTAGVVTAVGDGVERLRPGDEVVAIAAGTLGTHVTVKAALVALKPKNLSFEQAATIPVAFLTAYYTLIHRGQLASGQSILVHAGAGGVGQAAIQLARRVGATVYATASPSKWEHLRHLGVERWSGSRSLQFAEEVLTATGGRGVDAVLNCLTGNFIRKGLAVLAPRGRFIEIGKTAIWSHEEVAKYRADIRYDVFDLQVVCRQEPTVVESILQKLTQDFEAGSLEPIRWRSFPIEDAPEAFRLMQRSEHIGKLVLSVPEQLGADRSAQTAVGFRDDATYLITGGLGDLGLLTARWMIERGAVHVVLVSRHEPSSDDEVKISELERLGGRPRIARADVSRREQLAAVMHTIEPSLPLKGVVHAAGVLDDSLLLQQDAVRFHRVLGGKMMGAWHLHELTVDRPLDFFVLFASVAGVFGSTGQANHAAANAFLDALACHRRAMGVPALSIDWGIWSQLGAAARKGADTQARMKAMGTIVPRKGLEALEKLFGAARDTVNTPQVAVVPIDWEYLRKQTETTPFLADFNRGQEMPNQVADVALLKRIQESPLSERKALLEAHLGAQVAQVLGWAPDRAIDTKQGFFNTGMDSLTSLELRNLIQRSLGCTLPSTIAFDYPNIEALAGYLIQELPAFRDAPTSEEPRPPGVELEAKRSPDSAIAEMPIGEVREMIDQRLLAIEHLLGGPKAGT